MPNLKDRLLNELYSLVSKTRQGNVAPEHTQKFNDTCAVALKKLKLQLSVPFTPEDHTILPSGIRHADTPVTVRNPLTARERQKLMVKGETFRSKLDEAISRLEAYQPPAK